MNKVIINTLLVVLTFTVAAFAQSLPQDCRYTRVNVKGSNNADIAISSTAVTVLDAENKRCAAEITNNGTDKMRCAPITLTVSSTVGKEILPGGSINLSFEAAQQWQCIRVTNDTIANVVEVLK